MPVPSLDGSLPAISSADETEGMSKEGLEFLAKLKGIFHDVAAQEAAIADHSVAAAVEMAEGHFVSLATLMEEGAVETGEAVRIMTELEVKILEAKKARPLLVKVYERAEASTLKLMNGIARVRGNIHAGVTEAAVTAAKNAQKAAQGSMNKIKTITDKGYAEIVKNEGRVKSTLEQIAEEWKKPIPDLAKITELETNVASVQGQLASLRGTYATNKSLLDEAIDAVAAKAGAVQSAVEESTIGSGIRTLLGELSQLTYVQELAQHMQPIVLLGKSLIRSSKLVKGGYEAFAKSLIDGDATFEEFLEQVNNVTWEELDIENKRVANQLQELRTIFEEAGSEEELTAEVLARAAKWMNPSWRYASAVYEDVENVVKGFQAIETFGDFFKSIASAFAMITRTVARGALIAGMKTVEFAIGEKLATVFAETGLHILGAVGSVVATVLSVPVQAALLGIYMTRDSFKVHNFQQWGDDFLSVFITAAGVDHFPSLRIREYPRFSELVHPSKKKGKKGQGMPKMWEIDHKQLKSAMDFWAGTFIKEVKKHGTVYPPYRPIENYGGIWRIPGQYIDPKNHPNDPDENVDECKQIEKSLDLGTLVDEGGHATGVDKGGHLSSDLIPRKEGLIRNLVDFKLYKNTLVWPPRDGSFVQTKGNVSEKTIDPTMLRLWKQWIRDGTWGTIYHSKNATLKIKADAVFANKLDFKQYMTADRNAPFAWHDLKAWADGNQGKKAIVQQNMKGVTLAKLQEEAKTNFPVEGIAQSVLADGNIFGQEAQGSLNFIDGFFRLVGRYPFSPRAREFYHRVIHEKNVRYIEVTSIIIAKQQSFRTRAATNAEVARFTTVVAQYETYTDALAKSQGDTDKAWRSTFKETLWTTYVRDTSPRTEWGYIQRNLNQFIAEVQFNVNSMVGKRKAEIFREYTNIVSKVGIPLNTNRFHRLSFCARINQLVYANTAHSSKEIVDEIEKKGGTLLENQLITTGLSSIDLSTWAKGLAKIVLLPNSIKKDLPVFFGNLHCRIVIIPKPKPTCIVVFRGSTNFWEYVIDLDFTMAEYGSIHSPKAGEYEMKIHTQADSTVKQFRDEISGGAPSNFALHRGFLRAWLVFKPALLQEMKKYYTQYDLQDVIITGHSLGAGIAQIACLEFPSLPIRQKRLGANALAMLSGLKAEAAVQFRRPHCYCYSSPAVGDNRFSVHFVNQTSESAQIYIDADIVTLIPPILLPSDESWSREIVESSIADITKLAEGEGGDVGAAWILLHRFFKHFNLPFSPGNWRTGDKFDFDKIRASLVNIMVAFDKHRAVRGGGVFLRLSSIGEGIFTESPDDKGSTASGMSVFSTAVTDWHAAHERHKLDNVTLMMDKVAERHADLFDLIDRSEHPDWGDGGTTKPDGPIINPVKPDEERILERGKVIGVTRTRRRYKRFQVVPWSDIDPSETVWISDGEEVLLNEERRTVRKRQRRTTEGDYHGF